MYPDLDKALAYGVIGFLIIAVSYLWDKVCQINNTLYSVEEYIANGSRGGKTYGN